MSKEKVEEQRRYLAAGASLVDFEKNEDVDALYDLYLQIARVIRKPDENYMKGYHAEILMAGIIHTAAKLNNGIHGKCKKILQEMAESENSVCRLAVCSCVDNYSQFLIDEDERVVKLATARHNFDQMWQNASLEYKKEVLFLAKAIEYGLIDGFIGMSEDFARTCITYGSVLFDLPAGRRLDVLNLDEDVFRYVTDLRLQAAAIYYLIHRGVVKLRFGVEKNKQYLARMREKKKASEGTIH